MKRFCIKAFAFTVIATLVVGAPLLAHWGGPCAVFIYGLACALFGAWAKEEEQKRN